MKFTSPTDKRVARLIDANLNRAKEGLRVLEDWCRFGLDNKDFILKLKGFRHELGLRHHSIYKKARSAKTDKGAKISHPSQKDRNSTLDILFANSSRIQEALRVVEEFSRITDPSLSEKASEIRFEIYQIEIDLLKFNGKFLRQKILKEANICLITSPKENLMEIIEEALEAGVKMIQYRNKLFSDKKKVLEAKEICQLCNKYKAIFLVNDSIELALATNADGIHLGQNDYPITIARELLGEDFLIGQSTNNIEQIKKAEQDGFDYVGLGPIFRSKNKQDKDIIGENLYKEANKLSNIPCFAIGGINLSNIKNLSPNSETRIALIDGIINSKSIFKDTKKFINHLS
tara:strand:- start:399 stop:1436 length:1038 start_codon:yes stop_codon:yes gene_type:complete